MTPARRPLTFLALAFAIGAPACQPERSGGPAAPECETKLIRKIYAIPGTLPLIERTAIEVETYGERIDGEAEYTFTLRSGAGSTGEAVLQPLAECAGGSAACYGVMCVGTGKSRKLDPDTGFISAGVRVAVSVADEACRDESEIWIECLKPSDEQTCNTCIERIDAAEAAALGSSCLGPLWLEGPAGDLESGCLDDEACEALWSCQQQSLCHVPNPAACYCGELGGDPGACTEPSYAPDGACAAETVSAFEAQLARAPESNADVLAHLFDTLDAPAGFPSLAVANLLSSDCLRPDGSPAPPKTRALLEASGLAPQAIDTCLDACFR